MRGLLVSVLLTSCAVAQSGSPAPQPAYVPLTPKEKADLVLRQTFWAWRVPIVAISAAIAQANDSPKEWGQGWEAYGQRFGSRAARGALRQTIELGADEVLHTDPRYDRCACTKVDLRVAHTFKRVFVARADAGGETLNTGRIAGSYGSVAISLLWYPERYRNKSHAFAGGSLSLGLQVIPNLLREFSPEIRRALRRKPQP